MWLAILVFAVVILAVVGLLVGGFYAVVLLPIAGIVLVGSMLMTLWGRATGRQRAEDKVAAGDQDLRPDPSPGQPARSSAPTSPDSLVDARRARQ